VGGEECLLLHPRTTSKSALFLVAGQGRESNLKKWDEFQGRCLSLPE
jgi:hypothetical protein